MTTKFVQEKVPKCTKYIFDRSAPVMEIPPFTEWVRVVAADGGPYSSYTRRKRCAHRDVEFVQALEGLLGRRGRSKRFEDA